MQRWKIGDVSVTRVVEIETPSIGTFVLPDATPENVLPVDWLRPHYDDPVVHHLLLMAIY